MKTPAIVCAVLAGSLGISSAASAQGMFGHGDRGDRSARRVERQAQPVQHQVQAQPAERQARHFDRGYRQDWQAGRRFDQPRQVYRQPRYEAPRYVYNQPRYIYNQPSYRTASRFYRGGYLPYEYRRPAYYVNNWNAYSGLYAPPYGYQWMNVDGDFLLVALATGLIANALINSY